MIREIEAHCVTCFDTQTAGHPSRKVVDPLLQLPVRYLRSTATINKGNTVRISGWREISNGFPIEHERVNVRIRDIGNIIPRTSDNMTWIDLDVRHC